jgi:hypothetical protein
LPIEGYRGPFIRGIDGFQAIVARQTRDGVHPRRSASTYYGIRRMRAQSIRHDWPSRVCPEALSCSVSVVYRISQLLHKHEQLNALDLSLRPGLLSGGSGRATPPTGGSLSCGLFVRLRLLPTSPSSA